MERVKVTSARRNTLGERIKGSDKSDMLSVQFSSVFNIKKMHLTMHHMEKLNLIFATLNQMLKLIQNQLCFIMKNLSEHQINL